jgi:hypothetical protein
MQKIVCTMAVFAVGLLTPCVTAAAVHSGRVVFREPRNGPSIGAPPPPADQVREYDREVVIRYDASLGSLTFSAEVWDPGYWGEKYGEGFSIGSKCKEGPSSLFGPSELEASVKAQPKGPGLGGMERGGVAGEAALRGYTGRVESTGTFNGKRFEITFRSRSFRHRNWRCVEIHEPPSTPTTFHLGNWRPERRS